MKKLLLAIVLLFVVVVNAQKWAPKKYVHPSVFSNIDENESKKTSDVSINVSGEAKKNYLPDIMIIDFTVSAQNIDHKQAIVAMFETSNKLIDRLINLGFKKDEIKKTSYNVNEDIRYCEGTTTNKGFISTQGVQLSFNVDFTRLSKLFTNFADKPDTNVTFNYNTQYSKSLIENIKEELIDIAIKDSQKKAKLICTSANLNIQRIKSILYLEMYIPYSMNNLSRADMIPVKNLENSKPTLPDISFNEVEFTQKIDVVYIAQPQLSK